MPRDNKPKMSKKDNKLSKKKEELSNKKKRNEDSSDDDTSYKTDEDSEEMDEHEYRKFLQKIFPSKNLENKIASGERVKKIYKKLLEDDEEEDEEDEDDEVKPKKSSKKPLKKSKKSKSKIIEEDDDDEAEDEEVIIKTRSKSNKKHKKIFKKKREEDSEDETEDDDDDEDDPKSSKFNIIFTIGGQEDEEDLEDFFEDDEDWETCSGENTENEDDPISSDSDTEDEDDEEDDEDEDEVDKKRNKKIEKIVKKNVKNLQEQESNDTNLINKLKDALGVKNSEEKKDSNDVDLMDILKDLQSRNKNNTLIDECLKVCEEKIEHGKKKQEKKIKKEKDRNGRIFKRILKDKNTMNDFEFYEKLETVEQKKIIKELREINKITRIEKPYRLTLLESDIPVIFKAAAMKKISSLRYMEPGSGEFYKIKNWVDTFMRIPFSKIESLPLSIEDGVEKCHDFMANAQKTLNDAVYGLNDAKMQIMQMLGQLITNPQAIGSAIAIHGPPGTGKTSLVKEGISKILNRPFAFIALGGATDSSFLEGHGYTYEGSTWGKIVQILIDSKCMNPVIYFDELDKISDTPKGEEIAGILTHLTDTSQNSQFHDKYFAEIDFDLSKCLFIFSYNDESKVNPILKDRMYRIQTKGYNQKQKSVISNDYLLPRIRDQVKFAADDIIIPDQTLHYIIENHCNKEDGVRNLKRCLEIIYTKLNLYRLMRPDSNLFEEDMSLKVAFPFTVTNEIVDKMIKKTDGLNPSLYHLYL
uniref:ATPase AAA-type core domain-containing protein n=1 Tax=viral metagenome TaxID=1070528 RepID=A0A6C0KPE3_9ZZZZ